MLMNKCKKCNREFKTETGLFQHIRRSHDSLEYFKSYIDNSIQKCNSCGVPKKFKNLETGFAYDCSYSCNRKLTQKNERRKKTCLKLYGTENYNNSKKQNETVKLKYGNEPYFRTGTIKFKHSLKEKYGDKNYNNSEKMKFTKLSKYGNSGYNNIEKIKKTNLKKYGIDNVAKTEEVRNILSERVVSETTKNKMRNSQFKNTWNGILNNRFNDEVVILNEVEASFRGVSSIYKFKCNRCNNIFESDLICKQIPRCLTCYPLKSGQSKGENEIVYFLKKEIPDIKIIQRSRNIISGKELDIYLPDYNLAIEFNGIYYHGEKFGKHKNYHLDKTKLCKDSGIDLIHIFDIEWNDKREIIKSLLLTRLNETKRILYARKCEIKIVNKLDSDNFLIESHLQGIAKSSIRYGLYYKNELVSLMTFSKSRYSKKYNYEIVRMSNKLNTSVVGGFQKLFKKFKTEILLNDEIVVSYSDIRLFTGSIYSKMKFDFLHKSSPNYFYRKSHNLYSRLHFQKHKLKSKLKVFDVKLTEWENMKLNGFDRIWDCGNRTFIFQKID